MSGSAQVVEWQTRCLEGAVLFWACEFKSHPGHHSSIATAPWPSGKAELCKSFTAGSNPAGASKLLFPPLSIPQPDARRVKRCFPCASQGEERRHHPQLDVRLGQ